MNYGFLKKYIHKGEQFSLHGVNSSGHSRTQIHEMLLIYGDECVNWFLWTKEVFLSANFLTMNIIFNLFYSETQIKSATVFIFTFLHQKLAEGFLWRVSRSPWQNGVTSLPQNILPSFLLPEILIPYLIPLVKATIIP